MFLELPSNGFCFIDFLLKQIPNWKDQRSFQISSSAYEVIRKETFFNPETNLWIRKESFDEGSGKELSYELRQIRFDLWTIEWIEYNGHRQYFSTDPIGSAYITVASA